MGILDESRFIERHQFFDGQGLLATDLQGLEAFHREMRELHNRSLHQPGIGNGFAVTGERGDRQVTVGPGYALDAEGHEIILTHSREEPIPPVEGGDDGEPAFFHLTVSYPADASLEETETRQGLCRTHGAVRLREEPVFCWVRLIRDGAGTLRPADGRLDGDIREGRKIVLARLEVRACQLEKRPHVAQRRNARPTTQPRIACGRAQPAWTAEPLTLEGGSSPGLFLLRAEIDTREARFLNVPCYFARIDGPRQLPVTVIDGAESEIFADGLLNIESGKDENGIDKLRSDRFIVSILVFTASPDSLAGLTDLTAPFRAWSIEWMGIE